MGEPDGLLYLDFAVTALEQSIRLSVDSGLVFRGLAEVERALVFVEDSGWDPARYARVRSGMPSLPGYMLELGTNLLSSCPAGGVLLTGSDVETLSVWYGSLERPALNIIPLRPDLYATDSLYRLRMAEAMGVDPGLPVQRALAAVAPQRTLCLSPGTDSAAAPARRLGAVPARPAQPPARGRWRVALAHGAAQGLPPERLAVGPRSPRRVRWRRPLQRPPVQLVPPPLRRHAAAGMPSLKPAR